MKKNYILDWILFIVVLICVATGLILDFTGSAVAERSRCC